MAPPSATASVPGTFPPRDQVPTDSVRLAEPAWAPPLQRLGLGALTSPLEEMVRPVAWLGAQAVLILQPALSLFGAGPAVSRLVEALEALDSPPVGPAGEGEHADR